MDNLEREKLQLILKTEKLYSDLTAAQKAAKMPAHVIATMEELEEQGDLVLSVSQSGKKTVKSGTLESLVDRLVDPKDYDIEFLQSFILSHQLFVSSFKLLEMLLKRFELRIPRREGETTMNVLR